jgi:thiamine pyrophosphokinase
VVTVGLRYPLNGDTLVRGSTRGISNELIGEQASIEVKDGCLLVRHEHRAAL